MNVNECPLCGKKPTTLVCACCERDVTAVALKEMDPANPRLQILCRACKHTFHPTLCYHAISARLHQLREQLVALNEGRNLNCWPLGSFGWKDADLADEGCTGIKGIVAVVDNYLVISIGGHRTFAGGTNRELNREAVREFDWAVQELLSGCDYEMSQEDGDWNITYETYVQVVWEENVDRLAREIHKLAYQQTAQFRDHCKTLTERLNSIEDNLLTRYRTITCFHH